MSTNRNIVEWALQEIYVLGENNTASDKQVRDGLDALNRMMAQWETEDKDLGWPPQDTPGDTAPIPWWAEEAVITHLAIRIAPTYNMPIPAALGIRASTSESSLARHCINLKLEKANMSHLPQGARHYRYNIETDS